MQQEMLAFDRDRTIDERFDEWMKGQGAEVYRHFVEIADRLRNAGRDHFGGKALAEVVRYERAIAGKDAAGFKVNNSYVALMVRRLIAERPEYSDWFELRRLRSGEAASS